MKRSTEVLTVASLCESGTSEKQCAVIRFVVTEGVKFMQGY